MSVTLSHTARIRPTRQRFSQCSLRENSGPRVARRSSRGFYASSHFISLLTSIAFAENKAPESHHYLPTPARDYLDRLEVTKPLPEAKVSAFMAGNELYYAKDGKLERVMSYTQTIRESDNAVIGVRAKIGNEWKTIQPYSLPRDIEFAMEYLVPNPTKVALAPHEARAIAKVNFERLKSGRKLLVVKKELQEKARELAAKQAVSGKGFSPISQLFRGPYTGVMNMGDHLDADKCVSEWCKARNTYEHLQHNYEFIGLAGFNDKGQDAWVGQFDPPMRKNP